MMYAILALVLTTQAAQLLDLRSLDSCPPGFAAEKTRPRICLAKDRSRHVITDGWGDGLVTVADMYWDMSASKLNQAYMQSSYSKYVDLKPGEVDEAYAAFRADGSLSQLSVGTRLRKTRRFTLLYGRNGELTGTVFMQEQPWYPRGQHCSSFRFDDELETQHCLDRSGVEEITCPAGAKTYHARILERTSTRPQTVEIYKDGQKTLTQTWVGKPQYERAFLNRSSPEFKALAAQVPGWEILSLCLSTTRDLRPSEKLLEEVTSLRCLLKQ